MCQQDSGLVSSSSAPHGKVIQSVSLRTQWLKLNFKYVQQMSLPQVEQNDHFTLAGLFIWHKRACKRDVTLMKSMCWGRFSD